jgi:protein gp37
MYRDKERYGQDPTNVLRSKTKFNDPLKWKASAKVFTCSWSDWFIEEADAWRDEAWHIVKATPHLTYQILTKRPENIADRLPADWSDGYPNVWLGVSVENSAHEWRLKILQDTPAITRFASFEPLLGFMTHVNMDKLDLAIIGGESGNENGYYKYRPCEIKWIEELIKEARQQNTAVFVKQLGTYLAKQMKLKDSHGGNINEWLPPLQIREFPK